MIREAHETSISTFFLLYCCCFEQINPHFQSVGQCRGSEVPLTQGTMILSLHLAARGRERAKMGSPVAVKRGKSPRRLIPKARAIEAPQQGKRVRRVLVPADIRKKHGLPPNRETFLFSFSGWRVSCPSLKNICFLWPVFWEHLQRMHIWLVVTSASNHSQGADTGAFLRGGRGGLPVARPRGAARGGLKGFALKIGNVAWRAEAKGWKILGRAATPSPPVIATHVSKASFQGNPAYSLSPCPQRSAKFF